MPRPLLAIVVAAGFLTTASVAHAQVCGTTGGITTITATTPATTINVVGGDVKANSVSCGAGSSIVVNGQAGKDTINLNFVPPTIPVTTELGAGTNAVVVYGSTAADTFVCGATAVDRDGISGADLSFGTTFITTLTIHGKAGADQIDCSAFSIKVSVYAEDGNDTVVGSAFHDSLDGGPGADSITGNAGNDKLMGGGGNDVLLGGAGTDTFTGGTGFDGNDQITGGAGTDSVIYTSRTTAVVAGVGGEDTISDDTETIKGGKGNDTLDFSTSTVARNLYGGLGDDTVGTTNDGNPETINCGTGTDAYMFAAEDTFVGCENASNPMLTPVALAGGSTHACALFETGDVKCWGGNSDGSLGLGDTAPRGDDPGEMGPSLPIVDLGTGRKATQVAAGGNTTCVLLDDDSLKCWGRVIRPGGFVPIGDAPGEMGDALPVIDLGTGRTAVSLAVAGAVVCALLDNGSVKCWGHNEIGTLGLGDTANRGDDAGEMGDALPPVNLGTGRTAIAITAGSEHVCALLDNATVKCWGKGDKGQMGIGQHSNRGDQPGEMGDALPAVPLGTGRSAVAITAGQDYSCALLDNASVKCWGYNASGRLGLGDTLARGNEPGEMGDALPAVALGTGRTVVVVNAGQASSCAILDDGTTKCWGLNLVGELGIGDTLSRGDNPGEMGDGLPDIDLGTGRTSIDLVGGTNYACALLDDQSVKCWGGNSRGIIGQGDFEPRGDEPGEMGDALPPIDLSSTPALWFATTDDLEDPTAGCSAGRSATGWVAIPMAMALILRRRRPEN
jgi:alpha-tubulin suppressor-like RCC1 family protein